MILLTVVSGNSAKPNKMTCAAKPQGMWQLFKNSNRLVSVYFSLLVV